MRRAAAFAAASLAALGLAANASAQYAPRLVVDPASNTLGGTGALTVSYSQSAADLATARVIVYAPAGSALPADPAPGAVLGTANATALPTGGGPLVSMSGRLVAADPAAYVDSLCAPGPHEQVWLLGLAGGGEKLTIPVYVDAVTGADTALGSVRLEACLDPPGPTLRRLDLHLKANTLRASTRTGQLVWRSLFTPFPAGSEVPQPESTVESRAIVRQPVTLTLTGKVVKRGAVLLYGGLSGGGRRLPGMPVKLLANGKPLASTFTSSTGRYSFSLKVRKTTLYRVEVIVPAKDVTETGCGGATAAPVGCVTATVQPFHLLSGTAVKVTVRK